MKEIHVSLINGFDIRRRAVLEYNYKGNYYILLDSFNSNAIYTIYIILTIYIYI